MVEQRPGKYDDEKDEIPLSEKYASRYAKAKQLRDETLASALVGAHPNARYAYQSLVEQQEEGQQISHPDFVKKYRHLILATLPIFRLDLRRDYVRGLFNKLLEELDPENRDSTLLPIRESPLTIKTTNWDSSSQELLQMYALADNNALNDTLTQFDPLEAVDTFFTALEDSMPLLPFLPPNIATAWENVGGGKPRPEQVIKVKTNLMGVHVEYRPDAAINSGIPRTAITISPLR